MTHEVRTKIAEAGPALAEKSEAADDLGRLPDETGKRLRDCGVIRLLQPTDFGGYEADPRDFLNAVMDVGNWCPSAGWVSGVVGVHPWELAFNDRRLQEEVWGEDPDTWVASPYAPSGTAMALARAAADARGVDLERVRQDGRVGRTGPRRDGAIGLHALRGGSVTGHHTVWLAGEGERLELTHEAASREVFARGAVRAARWIAGRPPRCYSMRDVLGL